MHPSVRPLSTWVAALLLGSLASIEAAATSVPEGSPTFDFSPGQIPIPPIGRDADCLVVAENVANNTMLPLTCICSFRDSLTCQTDADVWAWSTDVWACLSDTLTPGVYRITCPNGGCESSQFLTVVGSLISVPTEISVQAPMWPFSDPKAVEVVVPVQEMTRLVDADITNVRLVELHAVSTGGTVVGSQKVELSPCSSCLVPAGETKECATLMTLQGVDHGDYRAVLHFEGARGNLAAQLPLKLRYYYPGALVTGVVCLGAGVGAAIGVARAFIGHRRRWRRHLDELFRLAKALVAFLLPLPDAPKSGDDEVTAQEAPVAEAVAPAAESPAKAPPAPAAATPAPAHARANSQESAGEGSAGKDLSELRWGFASIAALLAVSMCSYVWCGAVCFVIGGFAGTLMYSLTDLGQPTRLLDLWVLAAGTAAAAVVADRANLAPWLLDWSAHVGRAEGTAGKPHD